jgi:hypothetical protein
MPASASGGSIELSIAASTSAPPWPPALDASFVAGAPPVPLVEEEVTTEVDGPAREVPDGPGAAGSALHAATTSATETTRRCWTCATLR